VGPALRVNQVFKILPLKILDITYNFAYSAHHLICPR